MRHGNAREVEDLRQAKVLRARLVVEPKKEDLPQAEELGNELGEPVKEGLGRRVVPAHAGEKRRAVPTRLAEESLETLAKAFRVDQERSRKVRRLEVVQDLLEGLDLD